MKELAVGATVADHSPADTPTPDRCADQPPADVAVPDRRAVLLPADARVLVCSDLHLGQQATTSSVQITRDLVERLAGWPGPGAVVLNGDTFELWGEPEGTVAGALDAHPDLTAALQAFAAAPGRQVIVVVGNHDAPIAWDTTCVDTLAARVGATCALAVDLRWDTPAGQRVVRCVHGHAFDPANALRDPRNPLDSPLGQHIVQEVLPEVRRTPLLADVSALADPNTVGQFLASRLVYRQLGRRAWWLLLPLLAALLLRLPVVVRVLSRSDEFGHLQRWLVLAGVGLVVDVALLVGLAVLVARTVYATMAGSRLGPRGMHLNGTPRAAAAAACADGLAGLITGHTHQPELTAVAGGFYANTGCGVRCVESTRARFGLPPVFVPLLRRSWVELDVDRDVRVQLYLAGSPTGENTRLERLVARRGPALPATPQVVATLPGHAGWPLRQDGLARRARHERIRRQAAVAVGAAGLLSVLSALTTPLRLRLGALLEVLPVEVPQTAAASVAAVGVALLLLAWGLRRGRRLAWAVTVGLLAVATALHLFKGIDVEEAVVAAVVAGWLARHRAAFPTRPDSRQLRRAVVVLAGGGLVTVGGSVGLVLATGAHATAGQTARAVAQRLVGDRAVPLPSASPLLTPVLLVTGFSLLLVAGWLLIRPRLRRAPTAAEHRADLARARRIVTAHGGDTLAYFALRTDKCWFFTGDCVVAYDIRDGVCLVSPDPIGPPEQWADAWAEFMAFADRHGWPISVLGAGGGWLPIYQAAGLRPVYLGDEAIVDCTAFTMDGRPMKGLRQGYHRVQRAGYTVRFHDPAALPPELAEQLRQLMTESRQGDVERGFSMTLSRLFDPDDVGLVLSVAYGPDGRPRGFCHWVPASDIAGLSLDLMRRSTAEDVPNGLTDFIIIETIHHLRSVGQWGLCLNFAVMRAVLAGERGDGRLSDLQRRLLHRFSTSTQIESLWRFNAKYQPMWRPRYILLSGISTAPIQGLAIADAEGLAELPLIGRLLGAGGPTPPEAAPTAPSHAGRAAR